jgi:hypothetical protein
MNPNPPRIAASFIPRPCVILRQCRTKKHITPMHNSRKDEHYKNKGAA